jgi:hypothetical protein
MYCSLLVHQSGNTVRTSRQYVGTGTGTGGTGTGTCLLEQDLSSLESTEYTGYCIFNRCVEKNIPNHT